MDQPGEDQGLRLAAALREAAVDEELIGALLGHGKGNGAKAVPIKD
jgi:hypothetical protein